MSAITARAINQSIGTADYKGLDQILLAINKNLYNISAGLASTFDKETWDGVQKIVRSGMAPIVFPIGHLFKVDMADGSTQDYYVVAHDFYKSSSSNQAHTMTLASRDAVDVGGFSYQQAMFGRSDDTLPPGDYWFTIPESVSSWESGDYYITLNEALPAGGMIYLAQYPTMSLISQKYSIVLPSSTSRPDVGYIYSGSRGTFLGILGKSDAYKLNHVARCAYGTENYYEAQIRDTLNGYSGKTRSRFSTYIGVKPYINKYSEDVQKVIGEVVIPVKASDTYEDLLGDIKVGSTYEVKDKLFIPSMDDIFGTNPYPYYKESSQFDKIKYFNGAVSTWYLRSCITSEETSSSPVGLVHEIQKDGSLYGNAPAFSSRASIAFNIV